MFLRVARNTSISSIRFASTKAVEYDLIVIGGGSGGLACSKEASSLGARVALVDAVEPTPSGGTWGIGGTCANVGCIPKKLMHHATIVGKEIHHASKYGWLGVEKKKHDWATLVKIVDDRIKANNWIYRVQLNEKKVKYYNAFASFVDSTTVKTIGADKRKTEVILNAPNMVISTGLRPRYPDIPGAELGITSDDLFSLKHEPGKTLVVGGSYIALESAGLLCDLGWNTDLLIRSEPLKTFDRDCVSRVMENLRSHGVNIGYKKEVKSIRVVDGKKEVTFNDMSKGVYDTVIWAIGRDPRLSSLNMEAVNVKTESKTGRIISDDFDRTSQKGIYAIGDVAQGRPELTPTAIKAGQLLARRLFAGSTKKMSYENVATTVFTPLEFGTVGMSEEKALEKYGEAKIEVYHSYFTPFEYVIPQDLDSSQCYVKVVCKRDEPNTVLGIHIVALNAAEIVQGYAVAFRKGMTFEDLTDTVAIHPCSSEAIVNLSVTKRSGGDPKVTGCCG